MTRTPGLRFRRRALRAVSALALTTAAISAVGLAGLPMTIPAQAAEATDSAITIKWADDDSRAAEFQPARDPESIHYGDFDDLEIAVSQTADLVDQVVRVDVSGMPGDTKQVNENGVPRSAAYNFVQAMQCWGDPAAEDFHETCQWGGASVGDNPVAAEVPRGAEGLLRGGAYAIDVPFQAVWDESFASTPYSGRQGAPFNSLFNSANTNEVSVARIGGDGAGWFNFETQTADAAPHLGCGETSDTGAGTRCWLVIVPRGEHTSSTSAQCKTDFAAGTDAGKVQFGSPINPACDYWDNRIVVPLDFQPVGNTCPPGAAERRVAGSALATAAMSSWLPALCRTLGITYNFSSTTEAVARDQLLEGQDALIYTGAPVTAAGLGDGVDPALLEEADIVYAPIAVSAPAIGFYATSQTTGRIEQLRLTPRLVAKMLTVSYLYTVPWNTSSHHREHLPAANLGVNQIYGDPEFRAVNPNWSDFSAAGTAAPGLLMLLSGSDATAQLWKWLQADDRARAFLAGDADNVLPGDEGNAGMRINPYYLPKGHPNAQVLDLAEVPNNNCETDPNGVRTCKTTLQPKPGNPTRPVGLAETDGTPLCLCDAALDTVPRADETEVPWILTTQKRRFDLIQYNPPVGSFHEIAVNLQRGNRNMKTGWSSTTINAAGELGDWVVEANGRGSGGFLMGFTDTPGVERFGLSGAQLQLPNRPGVFAAADTAGLNAALAAQAPTEVDGVTQTDWETIGDDAYPLTMVTYAALNLTGSEPEARTAYANLIEQATTTGQTPGTSPGTLPAGYAPLSAELRAQAAAAVQRIRDYTEPVDDEFTPPDSDPPGTDPGDDPTGGETVTDIADPDAESVVNATATHGSAATPVGLAALGGSLLVGAAGAAVGPLLLRRRAL